MYDYSIIFNGGSAAEMLSHPLTITTRDYCGNYVYRNDTLERVMTDVGYIDGATRLHHAFVHDYQGNVRAVVRQDGTLVEYNAYYPYGMLMTGSAASTSNFVTSPTGSVQPYKYTGKELDRENGLDTYDFEARCYDPALATTWQQDPLADKYTQLSPYLWCAANPIRNTDPTGMEPVYNTKGDYINDTSNGFEGFILIYTGSEIIDPSKYTTEELIALMPTTTLDEVINILDENALSSIYTNVISHFEGTKVFEETFNLNTIKNGQIEVDRTLIGANGISPNWTTYFTSFKSTQEIRIIGSGALSYENTIENIACSVIAHEWYGHGRWALSAASKNHHLAYLCSMRYPLWNKTTPKYKEQTLAKYNYYKNKR